MKKYIYFTFVLIFISHLTLKVDLSETSEQVYLGDSNSAAQLNYIAGAEGLLKKIKEINGLTYQVGSRGTGVREFQNLLLSSGYSSAGKADGSYGEKTASAVKEFQNAADLSVTGKADLYTQFMLVMRDGSFVKKGKVYIAQINKYAVMIWPDTAFYIGALDQSDNFSEGTYYYSSGDYYAGEYKNNMRYGKGIAYFANGDVYVGLWENDAMNGNGTYYYGGINSKEYYKGNMSDNKMNGKGTYYLNEKKLPASGQKINI